MTTQTATILLGAAFILGAGFGHLTGHSRGWRRCEAMWEAEWDNRVGRAIGHHTQAAIGTSTWPTPLHPRDADVIRDMPITGLPAHASHMVAGERAQRQLTAIAAHGMDLPTQWGTLAEHGRLKQRAAPKPDAVGAFSPGRIVMPVYTGPEYVPRHTPMGRRWVAKHRPPPIRVRLRQWWDSLAPVDIDEPVNRAMQWQPEESAVLIGRPPRELAEVGS
jgi:hypothetical protein